MSLLDFLFPKKCVGCKKFGEYVCPNCFATLSFTPHGLCLMCGRPSFTNKTHPKCMGTYAIDGYFAALSYKGILKKLIYQFKYAPYLVNLQGILGDLLYEQLIQDEECMQVLSTQPILVPIPLSSSRLRKRGYNHAEILAKNLGKRLGLPVGNLLKRVKETKPQYGLKKEERAGNMKDAFAINVKFKTQNAKEKTAILVDDIVTTGSTLKEAARILKKNGFTKVYGIILAQD